MARRRQGARPAGRVVAIAWLAASVARGALAGSPADHVGRPVVDVRVVEAGRPVRDAAVAALVQTRAGAPLSMADVRDTIAHLSALGRYQGIEVDATPGGGGVALVYSLTPLRRIARIEFRGELGLRRGVLKTTVVGRVGSSPAASRVADARRALEALYRDRGYLHAEIAPHIDPEPEPDRARLVFDIRCGVRTRVGTIEVQGSPIVSPDQLPGVIGLKPGEPYDRTAVVARLTRREEALRARGYYEARVGHDVRFSEDGTIANLVLRAEPGPHVTLVFAGDPLGQREQQELVPIAREHSVDQDLLEDSVRRIENFLRQQGYREPRVEFSRTSGGGGLTVQFTVTRGPEFVLSAIRIDGNAAVPAQDIRALVRLADGQPFVESVLTADLAQVEDLYRRLGYADVKAGSRVDTAESGDGRRLVTAHIVVEEGARALVRAIAFDGIRSVDVEQARTVLSLKPGEPYYEPRLMADRDAVAALYLERGFERAAVQIAPKFSGDRSSVDLRVQVQEGLQTIVDRVLVVGNTRTKPATIEREIRVRPGQPLSESDLAETQRGLSSLGLFRGVRITQHPLPDSETRRDVRISLEEAPSTTVGYGGGVQGGRRLVIDSAGQAADRFEVAPSGFVEFGRNNLWGKNRSLNLFARTSLRLRGRAIGGASTLAPAGGYGFHEYRLLGTLREPKLWGTSADGLLTAYIEQAVRTSFNFNRRGERAEITHRVSDTTRISGRFSTEHARVFDENISLGDRPLVDRLFPQIRISSVSESLVRDTRDDQLDPERGTLTGLDAALAARAIGSGVGFFKAFLQGYAYRRLPGARRVVFAGGARVGLAKGFTRTVTLLDADERPVLGPDGQPVGQDVDDLPASERFFAGGDTTVRGFALDRLATAGTLDPNGFPIGGSGLLVLNAELRVPLRGSLGVVGFLDAGNVFKRVGDFDVHGLRASVGFGIRYRSPVGPLRVDLGFKLPGHRPIPGASERLTELHIGLGQAF